MYYLPGLATKIYPFTSWKAKSGMALPSMKSMNSTSMNTPPRLIIIIVVTALVSLVASLRTVNILLLVEQIQMQTVHHAKGLWLPESPQKQPIIATAILVEMRCFSAFPVALHGAIQNLGPEVLIMVIHSSHNRNFIRGVLNSSEALSESVRRNRLVMREFNEEDWGEKCPKRRNSRDCGQYSTNFWYSRMFVNATFWAGFETPYVLTLQSDTLLCRPFPAQALVAGGVSFSGGVSGMMTGFKKYTPATDPKNGTLLDHGEYLNGGFSFRNVQWVKACIQQYGRKEGWIEDDLYRHCQVKNINGTVHETEVGAYTFASDNGVTLCFTSPNGNGERICPLGVHKPWAILKQKKNDYTEMQQHCPGLGMLQKLYEHGIQKGEMCQAVTDLENSTAITFRCNCTQ